MKSLKKGTFAVRTLQKLSQYKGKYFKLAKPNWLYSVQTFSK